MATLGRKAPKTKGMASKPKAKAKPKSKGISAKQEAAQARIRAISERAEMIQQAGGTHTVKVFNVNRKDAIKEANEILYGKGTLGKKKATTKKKSASKSPKKKTASKAKPKKKGFSLF